jgi:hypothetical protein
MQENFSVAVTKEARAGLFELFAELGEVVDFAIENQDVARLWVDHGLVAQGREIENAEAAMPENKGGVAARVHWDRVNSLIVWAAMDHRTARGFDSALSEL